MLAERARRSRHRPPAANAAVRRPAADWPRVVLSVRPFHSELLVFWIRLPDDRPAILALVLDRLFPAHPGLSKKDRQHCARRLVLDRLRAGRRRHPENIRHHKAPHPGVQLGGAHGDFARKMLFQRSLIQWLAGLRVHHQLANHRLRDAQTHQDLDVVALFGGRNEGFSPAAPRLPRHCTGPFFLDPNKMCLRTTPIGGERVRRRQRRLRPCLLRWSFDAIRQSRSGQPRHSWDPVRRHRARGGCVRRVSHGGDQKSKASRRPPDQQGQEPYCSSASVRGRCGLSSKRGLRPTRRPQSFARRDLRAHAGVDIFGNSAGVARLEHAYLASTGPEFGTRESRHINSVEQLAWQHVTEGRRTGDCVALGVISLCAKDSIAASSQVRNSAESSVRGNRRDISGYCEWRELCWTAAWQTKLRERSYLYR